MIAQVNLILLVSYVNVNIAGSPLNVRTMVFGLLTLSPTKYPNWEEVTDN